MSNLVGHTYTSTDNEQSHIVFSLRAILHDYSTRDQRIPVVLPECRLLPLGLAPCKKLTTKRLFDNEPCKYANYNINTCNKFATAKIKTLHVHVQNHSLSLWCIIVRVECLHTHSTMFTAHFSTAIRY